MTTKIALPLVAVLFSGIAALAKEDDPVRSISVTGTAETRTAPDQIMWRISLSDADKNLLDAKRKSDEKVQAVLALREKLGISEGDRQTSSVSVSREYERDERGRRGDFKHFVVSRGITIRQHDLKRLNEYLDTLVSSADMTVNFGFESSVIHEIRAETRLKALQVAKAKAASMAEVVGAKLGQVLTIHEHPPDASARTFLSNSIEPEQNVPTVDLASDKFVPGAIRVLVTVYATFQLD